MEENILSVSRKGGCASVFLESGTVLRIPHAVYIQKKLFAGRRVDPERYRQWRETVEYKAALERAVKYLEGRERAEGEVRACLKRAGYLPGAIDQVLLTLKENRLLSDTRFAGLWVDARAQKLGRARIRQELRMKGVDEDTVRAALSAFTEEDETEMAAEQAKKLLRRCKDEKKLLSALARKGYSYSLARRALQLALEENEEE